MTEPSMDAEERSMDQIFWGVLAIVITGFVATIVILFALHLPLPNPITINRQPAQTSVPKNQSARPSATHKASAKPKSSAVGQAPASGGPQPSGAPGVPGTTSGGQSSQGTTKIAPAPSQAPSAPSSVTPVHPVQPGKPTPSSAPPGGIVVSIPPILPRVSISVGVPPILILPSIGIKA